MLSAVIRKQGERLKAFMQIVFWIPNSIMGAGFKHEPAEIVGGSHGTELHTNPSSLSLPKLCT